jgi:pimeloyl-ACP methyl ester carboxylesterase
MDVYFEDRGAAGVPMVLIHPAGATSSTWGPLVDDLQKRDRVITYDRRGFGKTGGAPAGSMAVHTEDLAALLDRLHCPPAVVFGISIGATLAIDLARRRPDLVHAVVAHESPWRVTRQPPIPSQVRALAAMQWNAARGRKADAVEAFLRFAYSYRDGGSAWDQFPEAWRVLARAEALPSLDDFRIAVGNYPKPAELANVSRPVVCTVGERSREPLRRVARTLERAIPTATVRTVPNAGHAVAFDNPAATAELLREAGNAN